MPANFTPDLLGYSGIRPFRWWCQKVLPLVYDDSLSYYELLCRVVNYLNNLISDVSNAEDNIDALNDAFVQLQAYVNGYLTDEKMQTLVNNKLDEMAEAGELDVVLDSLSGLTVARDGMVLFDIPKTGHLWTTIAALRLSGLDNGQTDVGSAIHNLKNVTREYTVEDQEYNLTIHFLMHNNMVFVRIAADPAADMSIGGSYLTYEIPEIMRPYVSIGQYVLVGAAYTAQLNILSTGNIEIGFTRRISDGQPAAIPSGTRFRATASYLSGNGQVYSPAN